MCEEKVSTMPPTQVGMRQLQSMTANPFGMLGGQPKKGSTGKRLTPKEREAQRKRLEKERRNKKKKK